METEPSGQILYRDYPWALWGVSVFLILFGARVFFAEVVTPLIAAAIVGVGLIIGLLPKSPLYELIPSGR